MQHPFTKRVLITIIIACALSGGIYLWQLFQIPTPITEHHFVVQEGEDIHRVAWNLKKEGIIKHRIYYYFTHFISGARGIPQPGVYQISTAMPLRTLVLTLSQEPWSVSVTLPPGLTKDKIGKIIGDKLGWGMLDREYFPQTYSGMQWQDYHDDLGALFKTTYGWNDKKTETFLTLSALYYDPTHDFFKKMYEPGTYIIPRASSRAQAAGILIEQFTAEREKEGLDQVGTLKKYVEKSSMDNISKLIETEMVLMPDIVAVPPLDVTLKKTGGKTYLSFTASYWNKGRGPLEFVPDPKSKTTQGDVERDVFQRIYRLDGGYSDRLSGSFLWHEQHHHYHYKDFAIYMLAPVDIGDEPIEGVLSQKSTFCIRDYNPIDLTHPGANKDSSYKVCGKQRQGISPGWADSYYYTYIGQRFDVTDLPKGTYRLTFRVNPEDRFDEITKENNVGEVLLSIDVRNTTVKVLEEKQYGLEL